MKSRFFTFFAAALCSMSALAQVSEEISIEPDLAMQAGIDSMLSAMREAPSASMRDLELAVDGLVAAANNDRKLVMLQMIYWVGRSDVPDAREHGKGFVIWFHELLKFSDEECLEIVLPYLTNRTPDNVRYFTRRMLAQIYHARNERGSNIYDFSFFANRIASQSDQDPRALDGLIDFIYEEGPGEAVLALMRAHGASASEIAAMEEAETYLGRMYRRGYQKRERDPEFDLDKIMAYLDYYSQSDHWWERLYVASMLGEVRQLRTDALIRRLRSDLHPVIRGKLSGIHPKDEQ